MHTRSETHGSRRLCGILFPLALILLGLCRPLSAGQESIVLQSTTSTQSSGLFDYLLPKFTAAHDIDVRVVAVGTGQALKNAADGNADVVLVHAEAAEKAFIAAGHGLAREPLMYNEFVIVGPAADPADVASAGGAVAAMARIAEKRALFLSRGDGSGTHERERQLWQAAGISVDAATDPWYRDAGSGMDRTLRIAAEIDGYTLCDRASWIAAANHGTLEVLIDGDPVLFNQYSLIRVNPERHPHVNAEAARLFVDWLRSPSGQTAIAAFEVRGAQLFFPNANAAQ